MPAAHDLTDRLSDLAGRRHAPLILELDLTQPLLEAAPVDPLARALSRGRPALREVLDGLRRAAGDERVRVLVAKIGGRPLSLARAQELRDAVSALRAAGTPTYAWAETFGESGNGTVPYYLASAFEQVWLQPSGDVGLTGVALEVRFLHDALAKAGVDSQIGARHEYKNAANLFTESELTPAHREAVQRLVSSAAEQVVAGVAAGRGLGEADVRALVDRAPLSAQDALGAGLVDRLGYRDEVYAAARAAAGEGAQLLYVQRYARTVTRRPAELARRVRSRSTPVLALVQGHGAIRLGRNGRGLLGTAMGADNVTAALRAAAREDKVAGIVFRVDSPGGSYVASDAIWREVGRARAAGKPVVVSMGTVAASGGYFVALPADVIVAEPGTLTGSIGVLGGKQVVGRLLDRVGIGHDAVSEGARARMHSSARAYDEDEWAVLDDELDRIYDDFTAKVAAGRGMTREQVHEVARGRVWTGADARERGLVDELGGLQRAVELCWERIGRPGAEPVVRLHPQVSPVQRLRPARSSEDRAASVSMEEPWAEWAQWGSLAGLAGRLGLPAAGPLALPLDYRIT